MTGVHVDVRGCGDRQHRGGQHRGCARDARPRLRSGRRARRRRHEPCGLQRAGPTSRLIPLSTGTNNAFPIWCEPTVAGLAAALVARGVVAVDEVSTPAKLVHVEVELRRPKSSVVSLGSPQRGFRRAGHRVDRCGGRRRSVRRLARAVRPGDDASARAHPGRSGGDRLLRRRRSAASGDRRRRSRPVRDGAARRRGTDAAAGGHGTGSLRGGRHPRSIALVRLGEPVKVDGPVILAFDGERKRRLLEGDRATLTIRRDGRGSSTWAKPCVSGRSRRAVSRPKPLVVVGCPSSRNNGSDGNKGDARERRHRDSGRIGRRRHGAPRVARRRRHHR